MSFLITSRNLIKGVLIETYWNVNMTWAYLKQNITQGLNRNILECKFDRTRPNTYSCNGLNRNILECKLS